MATNLPTAMLRSFITVVDAGSMQNAAEQIFVTHSAISLQIKRLEELVQQSLFERHGRKLVLTQAGATLLNYARDMIALHDDALTAIGKRQFAGPVRVGMVQDFSDLLLNELLGRFAELNTHAQVSMRIAGTNELLESLDRNQLDLVIGFSAPDEPDVVATSPMSWLGDASLFEREVIALAVLEEPCRFRAAAIRALDQAGRPWRIALESPNLSTLSTAVSLGFGVTCRTSCPNYGMASVGRELMPVLPHVGCIVRVSARPSDVVRHLATLSTDLIGQRALDGSVKRNQDRAPA